MNDINDTIIKYIAEQVEGNISCVKVRLGGSGPKSWGYADQDRLIELYVLRDISNADAKVRHKYNVTAGYAESFVHAAVITICFDWMSVTTHRIAAMCEDGRVIGCYSNEPRFLANLSDPHSIDGMIAFIKKLVGGD